jgi:hypothetical protein
MNNEKLALAMADVIEYHNGVHNAEENLAVVKHTEPYFLSFVITEQEYLDATLFEQRVEECVETLQQNKTKLAKAESAFTALLPKSVLDGMREEGRAVYASWVPRDHPDRIYGPYAAYFEENQLVVKRITEVEDFKQLFEARRAQE